MSAVKIKTCETLWFIPLVAAQFFGNLTFTFGKVPAALDAVRHTGGTQAQSCFIRRQKNRRWCRKNWSRSPRHSRECLVAVVLWKQQQQQLQRWRSASRPSRLSLAPINRKKASCCSISLHRDQNKTAARLCSADLPVANRLSGWDGVQCTLGKSY